MLTYEDISEAVLAAPGIESGFLQNTKALDASKGHKDGGAEARVTVKRNDSYRVVLFTKGKFADETAPDLMAAVKAAFEKLHVRLPFALESADSDEELIRQGVQVVMNEREFHSGYVPSELFLQRRMHIGAKKAESILQRVIKLTTPRDTETKKK